MSDGTGQRRVEDCSRFSENASIENLDVFKILRRIRRFISSFRSFQRRNIWSGRFPNSSRVSGIDFIPSIKRAFPRNQHAKLGSRLTICDEFVLVSCRAILHLQRSFRLKNILLLPRFRIVFDLALSSLWPFTAETDIVDTRWTKVPTASLF